MCARRHCSRKHRLPGGRLRSAHCRYKTVGARSCRASKNSPGGFVPSRRKAGLPCPVLFWFVAALLSRLSRPTAWPDSSLLPKRRKRPSREGRPVEVPSALLPETHEIATPLRQRAEGR